MECWQGSKADHPELAVLVARRVMQSVEDLFQKNIADLVSKHDALSDRIEEIMHTATWEMKSHGAAFLAHAGTMSSAGSMNYEGRMSPGGYAASRSVSTGRDLDLVAAGLLAEPGGERGGSPTSKSSNSLALARCSLISITSESVASGMSLIAGGSQATPRTPTLPNLPRDLLDAPLFVRHEDRTSSAPAKFRRKFLKQSNVVSNNERKSLDRTSPASPPVAGLEREKTISDLTKSWPAATDDPGLTVKGIGHGLGDILLEDFLPSTQKAQKAVAIAEANHQQKAVAIAQSGSGSPRLLRRPWMPQGIAVNSTPRLSAKSSNSSNFSSAPTLGGVCVDPIGACESRGSSIGSQRISFESPVHNIADDEDDYWMAGSSSEFEAGRSHRARLTEHIIADYKKAPSHSRLQPLSFDDPAMLLLRICGTIPWTNIGEYALHMERPCWKRPAVWYQWFMCLLPCLSCVVSLLTILGKEDDASLFDSGLLSDIAIAFGSLAGLIVAVYRRDAFVANFHLLRSYAQFENFVSRWTGMANRDVLILLLVWFVAVAGRVVVLVLNENRSVENRIPQIACFAVSSLILCSLAFCILYFARGMMCAVDSYCLHILSEGGFSMAVPRWNVVQAMLRKTSGTVHEALCVLQATVLLVFLLAVADVYQSMILQRDMSATLSLLVPAFLVMLSVSRIFFKAAEVTDRCMRVPSLINACMFGPDIDAERQYVVDYIRNSDAGFYMFEFRLTSNMTLKFGYLCIVAAFAIMTQLLGG